MVKLVFLLVLAVFTWAWSVTVISYRDFEVYNGSLLLADGKAYTAATLVVPGGWPLRVVSGNFSLPLDVVSDVVVVLGSPSGGCDVYHFYSIAQDATAVLAVCSERVEAVVSADGGRRAVVFQTGVNYIVLPGRSSIRVESSTAPVRIREREIYTAHLPAVAGGSSLSGGPPAVYNTSLLYGRIYNLAGELAALRESCSRDLTALRKRVDELSGEVNALKAERDRLLVVGPNAVALYAAVGAGVAAGTAGVYLAAKRRGR
ncbi:hypothetical protein [Pyrobaculum neutrophilum]|uniref:Uncharacterized protein n=1 Tax=Pyrobaculum neutrophilum (strain DSM 2338 / JCM 9278 / NBRC 100436 / V24Sta) TaxID=444157 RepID=B1YDQ4_PYRNV|nr:hypothetical protein [Pyrobaculum neutrophilum]ACB39917.1 hypothetical protein Tneu_0984 [Pyrobaculum neutrophilum V24Sta]